MSSNRARQYNGPEFFRPVDRPHRIAWMMTQGWARATVTMFEKRGEHRLAKQLKKVLAESPYSENYPADPYKVKNA